MSNLTANSTTDIDYISLIGLDKINTDKLIFSFLIVIGIFLFLAVVFAIMYLCKSSRYDDDEGWQVVDWHKHHSMPMPVASTMANVTCSKRTVSSSTNKTDPNTAHRQFKTMNSLDYGANDNRFPSVSDNNLSPLNFTRSIHPLLTGDDFQAKSKLITGSQYKAPRFSNGNNTELTRVKLPSLTSEGLADTGRKSISSGNHNSLFIAPTEDSDGEDYVFVVPKPN